MLSSSSFLSFFLFTSILVSPSTSLHPFSWRNFGRSSSIDKSLHSTLISTTNNNIQSIESEWLPYYDNVSGYDEDYIINESTSTKESIGEGDTYGEILPTSMRAIIQHFMNLTSDDIMYDLGSGTGKIVTQFAYETKCGKCIGIELGELRHTQAISVLETLKQIGNTTQQGNINTNSHPSNKIELRKGDCTKLYWGDATVLFINALCFPTTVWTEVEILIRENCPNLRYLIIGGQQLSEVTEMRLNMSKSVVSSPASWADDYICFFYTMPSN